MNLEEKDLRRILKVEENDSIPTAVELLQEVTCERIRDWEHEAGESFLDQTGYIIPHLPLAGFFMAKYPEKASDLIQEVINNKYGEAMSVEHVIVSEFSEENYNKFFDTLCEYINLTVNTKIRVNYALITGNI